jgi:transposase-like protein
MKKIWLLSLSVALLAGCAVSDRSPVSADVRPGAVCTGCGTTWVMSNGSPGKPGMYAMQRKYRHSDCPFCAQTAMRYMSSNRIEGKCPECGKTLQPCMFEVCGASVKKAS